MESLKKADSSQYKVDINITLTELEKRIFKTFMDVVEENKLNTTLRVAGGWVRDKVKYIRVLINKNFLRFLEKRAQTLILPSMISMGKSSLS
jgi:hypothetical protein